jgi:hypothetical protein
MVKTPGMDERTVLFLITFKPVRFETQTIDNQ